MLYKLTLKRTHRGIKVPIHIYCRLFFKITEVSVIFFVAGLMMHGYL